MDTWNEKDVPTDVPPAAPDSLSDTEGAQTPAPDRTEPEAAATPPWLVDAPAFMVPDAASEPSPARTRGGHGPLVAAFALLVLATVGVGIVAMKLWFDRSNAQAALRAAVTVVGSAGPVSDDAGRERLKAVGAAVERGQFVEVADQLRRLARATPATPGTEEAPAAALPGAIPGLPGIGSEGGDAKGGKPEGPSDEEIARKTGLPPEAVAFFRAHQELGQVFGQANQAALALKKSGGDVTRLRSLRNEIISAARLNDEARVKQLLDAFAKEFATQGRKLEAKRGKRAGASRGARAGRAGGGAPPALMKLVGQASEVLQNAQAAGKDVSPAIETMRRAEMAGRAGNFALAEKLTRQAIRQAQTARKMPPQPELFRNPIVAMCLNLMRVEDRELGGTLQSLRQTLAEAGQVSAERLRGALKAAADTITRVGKRRTGFGRTLQRIETGKQAAPVAPTAEQVEAASRQRVEGLRRVIAEALTRAQGMAAQEFTTTGRDQLAEAVLQAVFGPPKPQSASAAATAPVTEAPEPPAEVRQRVQAKLLAAAQPYLDVCSQPEKKVLAKLLATTFAEARRLLAAGDLAAAERKTDEGLKLLAIDPATVQLAGSATEHSAAAPDTPAPSAGGAGTPTAP